MHSVSKMLATYCRHCTQTHQPLGSNMFLPSILPQLQGMALCHVFPFHVTFYVILSWIMFKHGGQTTVQKDVKGVAHQPVLRLSVGQG